MQVKEGLIQVSDPPLHGRGNFLDSPVELDRRLMDYIVGLDTEINELVDGSVILIAVQALRAVSQKQLLFSVCMCVCTCVRVCVRAGVHVYVCVCVHVRGCVLFPGFVLS